MLYLSVSDFANGKIQVKAKVWDTFDPDDRRDLEEITAVLTMIDSYIPFVGRVAPIFLAQFSDGEDRYYEDAIIKNDEIIYCDYDTDPCRFMILEEIIDDG